MRERGLRDGGCTPWRSFYWDFICIVGFCMGLWAGRIHGNGLISALFSNQPLFPLWEHHVIPALAFGRVLASAGWSACIVIRN